MIVPYCCSMVLPCSLSDSTFYLTHPYGFHLSNITTSELNSQTCSLGPLTRKWGGPAAWGPALENGTPFHRVVRSPCGRSATSRTVGLHAPPPHDGKLVSRVISLAGPTTSRPELSYKSCGSDNLETRAREWTLVSWGGPEPVQPLSMVPYRGPERSTALRQVS